MNFWSQFRNRNARLILTLISKQWLVFFIGTWLLWNKCITPEVWVVLAGVVIGANVFQKWQGVQSDPAVKPAAP
jgi:hypothetical protein